MIEDQKITEIPVPELERSVRGMKDGGYRLVQIGATTIADGFEVNYSFDKEYHFVNIRVKLGSGQAALPSVSPVYWNAFLYENEIQDLFGIRFKGMAIDYHGQFYKTAVKVPFGSIKMAGKDGQEHG